MKYVLCCVLTVVMNLAMVFNAQAEDGAILQQQIDAAIKSGQSHVSLPTGIFEFTDQAMTISDAANLTVDGSQTTIVGKKIGIPQLRIQQSSNITVRGLTVDMDPLPFTQGSITQVSDDGQTLYFQIHDGYPRLAGDYIVKRLHVYERDQRRLKPGVPDVYLSSITALSDSQGVAVSGVPLDRHVQVGDRVVLNIRKRSAVELVKTDSVTLDHITVYTCAGLGFSGRFIRGDNKVLNCVIKPGPTPAGATQPRLLSTSADGLNFAYARKGPIIRNCDFSFMGDDGINFHGVTFPIYQQVSSTQILVGRPYGHEPFEWLIEPGDALRLLSGQSFGILATRQIKSFEYVGPADDKQMLWVRKTWHHGTGKGSMFRITLQQPVEQTEATYLDIPATAARGFEITDSYFHDHRARGLRIQTGEGLIARNRFKRLKSVGISLGPEYAFWREAGWVDHVTITDNTLIDVGQGGNTYSANSYILGAISVFFRCENPLTTWPMDNRDLIITHNRITRTPLAGIFVRAASNVRITDNQLTDVLLKPRPEAGSRFDIHLKPIDVDHARDVTVENNTIK